MACLRPSSGLSMVSYTKHTILFHCNFTRRRILALFLILLHPFLWFSSKKVGGRLDDSAVMAKCVFRFEAAGRQRVKSRRSSLEKTARAVWHHRGARVARQRCPILREGRYNIHIHAGGCKALNANTLGKEIIRI